MGMMGLDVVVVCVQVIGRLRSRLLVIYILNGPLCLGTVWLATLVCVAHPQAMYLLKFKLYITLSRVPCLIFMHHVLVRIRYPYVLLIT